MLSNKLCRHITHVTSLLEYIAKVIASRMCTKNLQLQITIFCASLILLFNFTVSIYPW